VLSTFSLGENAMMETRDGGAFSHDEANITTMFYVIYTTNYGKDVMRVVSDDTKMFVLLVYWIHRAALQCKVQMEQWNGTKGTRH